MILQIFNVFAIRIIFSEREFVSIQTILELAFETAKSKCISRHLIRHWKILLCPYSTATFIFHVDITAGILSQEVMLYNRALLHVVEH